MKYEVEQMENWADSIEADSPYDAAHAIAKKYYGDETYIEPWQEYFDIYSDATKGEMIDTFIVREEVS